MEMYSWDIDIFTFALTLLTVSVCYLMANALFFSPLRNVPGPFLARLSGLRASLIHLSGTIVVKSHADHAKYGPIYVMAPNMVAVSSQEDIKTVLGTHAFRKSKVHYQAVDLFGIENVFSARTPELVNQRKRQLGSYLGHTYLSKMEPAILKSGTCALKAKWDKQLAERNSVEIEYNRDFVLASLDVISTQIFGYKINGLETNDMALGNNIIEGIAFYACRAMFPLISVFPFSLLLSKWQTSANETIRHCRDSIHARRKLVASGAQVPTDLLQAFLDAEDPESRVHMTEEQILADSIMILAAGSDSIANAMTWLVHLLMLYPVVYKRAVDEVRANFSRDTLVTYAEAKAKLPYLEACIYEMLRVSPMSSNQHPKEVPPGGVTMQGHFLPAGTVVFTSFGGAHMDASVWDEPYRFNPDRFINVPDAKRSIYAFSAGVRGCPGRNLSFMKMMTISANMLKDYDLALPDDLVHLGPDVLDSHGYPKLMDSAVYIFGMAASPERDCRLVLSRRK